MTTALVHAGQKRPAPPPAPELTKTGRQRRRKVVIEEWVANGRLFVRYIDMWALPVSAAHVGLTRLASEDEQPASLFTAEQNYLYDVFQAMTRQFPKLLDELLDGNVQGIVQQTGAAEARANDTRSIKEKIMIWLAPEIARSDVTVTSAMDTSDKTKRGFYHPVTGRLLCPVQLDWNDPKVQDALRTGQAKVNGKILSTWMYATFLYDGSYNPDMPWVGFLRGKLVVQAWILFFMGPTAALKAAEGHPGPAAVGNGKRAAAQVLFGLSSATTHMKNNSTDEARECVEWWNRRIFGTRIEDTVVEDDSLAFMIAAKRKHDEKQQETATAEESNTTTIPEVPSIGSMPGAQPRVTGAGDHGASNTAQNNGVQPQPSPTLNPTFEDGSNLNGLGTPV
ncbi:hypothetical protein EVJ58_g622 [Rhodofomes roseus]|uniref:Uncharacterized protein n=1 Tax=Rhodofomes roseus TaxID=34475 RepID=A0A4Y9Z4K1_9APHY|nr:hypothetical protein EVJ58_g622 [Rhodofomes roseus]